jgi:hypothetical protein
VALITLGGVILFVLVLLRGSAVALEDRFLRPTAVALLLALAFTLDHPGRTRALLIPIALLCIAGFGMMSAAQRTTGLLHLQSRGHSGLAQHDLDPAALRELSQLDRAPSPHSRLVYVPFPGAALELPRQRVLVTDDFMFERAHRWQGRVPELIAALPATMEQDGRGARIRRRFVDYSPAEWQATRAGDWYFWTATTSRP